MISRWWLVLALLLSVGVNVGLAASVLLTRRSAVEEAAAVPAASADPQVRGMERLASRLGLEGERRQSFVEIHRSFFNRLRRAQPRIERLRRELRRELLGPHPDRQRLDTLLRQVSRTTLEIERAVVDLTVRSRELLDDRQERVYLEFLARRLPPVRDALGPPTRRTAPPR